MKNEMNEFDVNRTKNLAKNLFALTADETEKLYFIVEGFKLARNLKSTVPKEGA